MTLPVLYVEGLTQRALRGREHLNVYKLGLIEAILKDSLHAGSGEEAVRSAVETALEVARWEMRPPSGRGT
ncbi:MAG: hypothetical protein KY431_05450 [Actinobacteria bacterium]|nr:hypothetical protein [Actinomycetota bacterium]